MSRKRSDGKPRNGTSKKAQFENLRSPELAPYWLSAIIESADDAVISKTLDGIITSWNKGAERIFGYTADEVIGKPVTILIPADHVDEEPNILARLRAGGCGAVVPAELPDVLVRIDHAATAGCASEAELAARRTLDIAKSPITAKQIAGTIIAN